MTDNTFKQNTFVLKEDGKIVWIEKMPEVPSLLDCQNIHFGKPDSDSGRMLQKLAYKQAVQSAIANGIEVENHKEVIAALKYHHLDKSRKPLEEGKLYPLHCRVEVIEEWIPGQGYNSPAKEIARVTFEQPENLTNKYETGEGWLTRKPEAAGQEQEIGYKGLEGLIRENQSLKDDLYTASLQKQVEELREENERLKELLKESISAINYVQELERKYNLLRHGN
jgi:hypothetical protein